MCYEFAHSCDQSMLEEIDKLLQKDKYFMVSILQLNYLYIKEASTAEQLKSFLRRQCIILHTIKAPEMQHIINFPDTLQLQKIYGDISLTDAFHELVQQCRK